MRYLRRFLPLLPSTLLRRLHRGPAVALLAALALALPVAPHATAATPATTNVAALDPFAVNRALGRAVNLGNALDAPTEGEWGVTLSAELFDQIKAAGFESVRLPVRWSSHAAKEAPYTIDPAFIARVEWAVQQALDRGLPVILNLHHYREIYADPAPHRDRYLGLWKQIAPHFKDLPDSVVFELMNEPDEAFTPQLWNDWLVDALAIVRESNPRRTVMIGPGEDNTIDYLKDLRLPEADRNIIVTVHFYHPLKFTHQGAEWLTWADAKQWLGTPWGSPADQQAVIEEFDRAVVWAKEHRRPLNLGEFGAIKFADFDSRVRWTAFVAQTAHERGMSYHYWEFCADFFGVYDQQTKQFREPLLRALLPKP